MPKEPAKEPLRGPRLWAGLLLFALSWAWALGASDWRTLWPSMVALGLVLLWRRVLTGLLLGGLAGCVILAGGNPLEAVSILIRELVVPIGSSTWKLGALAFTLILGGMAALIERSGGLQAILERFLQAGRAEPRQRVQWAAYLLGLVCFFDGLANSMLVGRLMKSLAARTGVSGVKLAYIVDSTSSAVACLALISTWIAYQLAMIREGYAQVGQEVDAYGLFIASIPLNFYCWFTLLLLALSIARNFNPGPMGVAEAEAGGKVDVAGTPGVQKITMRMSPALVPLGVLIGSLFVGLYLDGAEELWPLSLPRISQAYGQADATTVLVVCSLLATFTAMLMLPRKFRLKERMGLFAKGASALFTPALVLIGAWILGGAMAKLGTAGVLAGFLGGEMPIWLLPGAVFIVGALISFCTGTSWGTMGILMPLSIPVVFTLSGGEPGALMPAVVAAVFSGAVFGDHCSPISDTTLVSAISCGVSAEAHVRTQLPYAIIAACVAFFIGFIPVGLGLSGWGGLLLGAATLLGIVLSVSRK